MASSPLPVWMTGELDLPDNPIAIDRAFRSYREALSRMPPQAVMAELTRINAELQRQADEVRERTIRVQSSGSASPIDQLVPRTTPPRSTPDPSSRGRAALGSQASPPPDPLSRLFSPRGRALASKLVAANARSVAHRRVR